MYSKLLLLALALSLRTLVPAQCWESISYGRVHAAGVMSDGTLWTWGGNIFGQLGDGSTVSHSLPMQVGSDSDWAVVCAANMADNNLAIGGSHTAAIKSDGTLWTWGSNSHGQLGDGTVVNRLAPTQVGSDGDWAAVQCGALYTLAIRTDSTLWSWGHNAYGQLGVGNTTDVNVPTQVGTATNWMRIATASEHSLALASDSSLWSWGLNQYYQLGFFNDNQNKTVPTRVGLGTSWRSIATGRNYSFAIKGDNTLWGWGRNDYGQLGLGNNSSYHPVPQQIGTGAYWQQVDCGVAHTLAQRTNGSLWGWGYNYDGQLGVGNNTFYYFSAQQIPSGGGSVLISAGAESSASIRIDGQLWTSGQNWEGILGIGGQNAVNVPVMVACAISTAIAEGAEEGAFNVYPVPTEGAVLLDQRMDEIWLFDLNGKELQHLQQASRIDLSSLASGSYILHVRSGDRSERKRLVKY